MKGLTLRIKQTGSIFIVESKIVDAWYYVNSAGFVTGGLEAPITFKAKHEAILFIHSLENDPIYYDKHGKQIEIKD